MDYSDFDIENNKEEKEDDTNKEDMNQTFWEK
jgi:hypothetical protein